MFRRFELKFIESDYFTCMLIGYDKNDIGIYAGGFVTTDEAIKKMKELIEK